MIAGGARRASFASLLMNRLFSHRRVLRHAALVSWLSLLAPGAAVGQSLLPDGSFEKPDGTGEWPRQWPRARNVSWESEAGNWFLRLSADGAAGIVSVFREVPIPAGVEALELSFRRRVTGLTVGAQPWHDARVMMNFKDAGGKKTPATRVPYLGRDTDGWQQVTHRLRLPAGTVALEFMPSLVRVRSGEFDIDDIMLTPIDPGSVP